MPWKQIRDNIRTIVLSCLLISLSSGLLVSGYIILSSLFMAPLKVPSPEQLFFVETNASSGDHRVPWSIYRHYIDMPGRISQSFAWTSTISQIYTDGNLHSASIYAVDGAYFQLLGLQPVVGRLLPPGETSDICIISSNFWKSVFRADRQVVGKAIRFGDHTFLVAGVADSDAASVEPNADWDVVFPLDPALSAMGLKAQRKDNYLLDVLIRTDPNQNSNSVTDQLDRVWTQSVDHDPPPAIDQLRWIERVGTAVTLTSASRGKVFLTSALRSSLWLLLCLAIALYLSALSSVASLLIAQASAYRGALVVRFAIGATLSKVRTTLFGRLAILVAPGFILAPFITFAALRLAPHFLALGSRVHYHFTFAWQAYLISGCLDMVLALLAYLTTHFAVVRAKSQLSTFNNRTLNTSTWMIRNIVFPFQVVLTIWLIFIALSCVMRIVALSKVQLGFNPHHLVMIRLNATPPVQQVDVSYFAGIIDEIRELPGVTAASIGDIGPLEQPHDYPDNLSLDNGKRSQAVVVCTFGGLFETLGTGYRGEQISLAGNNTVVISRNLAKALELEEGPLGVSVNDTDTDQKWTVQGVADDLVYTDPSLGYTRLVYRSCSDALVPMSTRYGVMILARANITSQVLGQKVATILAKRGKQFVLRADAEDDLVKMTMQDLNTVALLSVAFGIISLLPTCIGVYAVVSFTVSQKEKVLGLKAALGCPRWLLGFLPVKDVLLTCLSGLFISSGVFFLSEKRISMSLSLSAAQITIAYAGGTLIVLVMLIAAIIPAVLKAMTINPANALRKE